MHPIAVKTPIIVLLVAILGIAKVYGQKTVYVNSSQISYDYKARKTNLISTGKPFTGVEYTVNYYSSDTTQLRRFDNGILEWMKHYDSNQELTNHQIFYLHGLKNDSICMEHIVYYSGTKDTNYYEVQYLTKDNKKMYVQKQYQQTYDAKGRIKPYLYSVRTMRFFHKRDAQYFSEQQFKESTAYDSAGFHSTYADYGLYQDYYPNGKVHTEGSFNSFDYRVKNRGAYPTYPLYGKTGTWIYYRYEGTKEREEYYREGVTAVPTIYYYANGRIHSQMNYQRLYRELQLPVKNAVQVNPNDTCMIIQSSWTENNVLASQSFRTPKGDVITCSYHANGFPQTFGVTAPSGKPIGLHVQWDEKGRVKQFINYSVESNDTLCYTAAEGKIRKLNLRSKTEPMNWDKVVYNYNYTSLYAPLYNQTVMYKEFHANGRQKSEIGLRYGERNGTYVEWDSTGMLIAQCNYRNDLADGQWSEWHANGKPKKMFMYKEGLRNGACSEYYESGELKWENTYTAGVPSQGKAYSENGTLLKQTRYPEAFYPSSCIKQQKDAAANVSLYFFLQDTAISGTYMTFSDTVIRKYADKVMVLRTMYLLNGNYCSLPVKQQSGGSDFDAYHSRFVISETLNTAGNRMKMKSFFGRHNIQMTEPKLSESPVLGLEKEYTISYSSTSILNKQGIIDSLEILLIDNANDIKQGYLMSVDLNLPSGSLTDKGGSVKITSHPGYSIIHVENKEMNTFTYTPGKKTETFIIYDDLTCDLQQISYTSGIMQYWALNPR